MRIIFVTALALSVAWVAFAQPAGTRGTATDITNADIEALAKTMAVMPAGDQLLRVVGINNGEYNVGVAVSIERRRRTSRPVSSTARSRKFIT
jgi:hypothetical protein